MMKNAPKITRREMMIASGASMISIGLNTNIAKADTALETALAPRVLGNPNAPILMAEYFSLSCSHCADFHHGAFKDIKANWIDTGKLRFEMRDFPLQGPAILPMLFARSVPVNAYSGMLDILFKKQRGLGCFR